MFYLITKINKTLGRGDPVRLFLLSIIYQIVVQRIDRRLDRQGKSAQVFARCEPRQHRSQMGAARIAASRDVRVDDAAILPFVCLDEHFNDPTGNARAIRQRHPVRDNAGGFHFAGRPYG